jgi:hypothetical protein
MSYLSLLLNSKALTHPRWQLYLGPLLILFSDSGSCPRLCIRGLLCILEQNSHIIGVEYAAQEDRWIQATWNTKGPRANKRICSTETSEKATRTQAAQRGQEIEKLDQARLELKQKTSIIEMMKPGMTLD